MSFYVEVMCNLRKPWPKRPEFSGKFVNRCMSDRGDNPQGYSLPSAVAEAKEQGWKVKGRHAVCPMCQEVLIGEATHG